MKVGLARISNPINRSVSFYSSLAANKLGKLDPFFITGFTDAEGSFILSVRSSDRYTSKWKVQYAFSIGLHEKDIGILEKIQFTLGVGKIYTRGKEGIQYIVESQKDLAVVIDHFNKYPLHTKKQIDFKLFKLALVCIKNKEHLTLEGLKKLVAIKASMNKGLTGELKALFPDITPMVKSESEVGLIIDPQWLAGFTCGEGCFSVSVFKSEYVKLGYQVQLIFRLTQHIRDVELMESLVSYLGGRLIKSELAVNLQVTKLSDLTEKVLPLLEKYPIEGVKFQDYCDFVKVVELVKNKSHLTTEGLSLIQKIKVGMNTGR